jgi:hypothetical protein
MAERRKLQFFLLRYVPNAVRGESLNIGLLMTESGKDEDSFVDVHFTQDWKRARCLFPDTDVEMLEAIGREIKSRIANVQDRAALIKEMTDRYSNAIQLSRVRRVFAQDPAVEMKHLVATLVETPWMSGTRLEEPAARRAGRKWILAGMTEGFRTAGVMPFLTANMPVSTYTNDTDRFTFDYSYSFGLTGETTRVFHAVSLVDKNKETEMFPFRVAKIAPKLARLKKTQPTFTAIVEDHFDAGDAYVASVLAFMKDENIQVSHVREMADIAEVARRELRA